MAEHQTFWQLLDASAQGALSELGRYRIIPDTHSLMLQGDTPERVYVVMEGRVKVCMVSDRGKETVLDLLGPGDIVGELEAVDRRPRLASAVAKGMIKVLELPGEQFRRLALGSPVMSEAMFQVMSGRLRSANEIRAARSARDRVIELLHQIAHRERRGREGEVAVNPGVNSEEFANWAGTSRGAAGRALSWLQGRGVIQRVGHEIKVNLEELHKSMDSHAHERDRDDRYDRDDRDDRDGGGNGDRDARD
ncbi:Crp/Fnr family transcriptional regulator [Spirillospora sp. NPDC047279]|uniref:Crp/Fnr family transcriptional regulator n=1 Tax=Spirillospora sp. NPDC047279 TaxID=3155478 RepID=UPI0033F17990